MNNELRELAEALNTSTSDWLRAYSTVTNPYEPATEEDIEEFMYLVIEKRDQAVALLDVLSEMADRL
jgi:hypothetical protein